MYVMFGLFMLMGIIQKPTLKLHFTTKKLISTSGFRIIIFRDRFEDICQFLDFGNNKNEKNFTGPKILFKIYDVAINLKGKFQKLYLPRQNISIDKSLTL